MALGRGDAGSLVVRFVPRLCENTFPKFVGEKNRLTSYIEAGLSGLHMSFGSS